MSQALADVKRDLGRDAVILHTRNFRRGGLFGVLGGRPMWEVTASSGVNVLPRQPGGQYISAGAAVADAPVKSVAETVIAPAMSKSEPVADGELSRIHCMLESLLERQGCGESDEMPPLLKEYRDLLIGQDVAESIAEDIIGQLRMSLTGEQLASRPAVSAALIESIAGRISSAEPINTATRDGVRGHVIALVGPTGVGKTTTIAKLAANMKLRENKRVGLITIDTYRIAAVDQLRTYAQIIEVPLRTAATPQEMTQAIYAMRGMDVVLIDTVGRSQNDQLRLNQLRAFLTAADADEVHLVVAGTVNRRCAANIVSRFGPLGVNRVIVTKLDEAEAYGTVLNLAGDIQSPLSYISAGQEVPDDISPANPHELARLIVEGAENAA